MKRLVLTGLAAGLLCLAGAGSGGAGIAPTSVTDVVDTARRATVTIRAPSSDGAEMAVGAGFVHAGTRLVVTNAHVVGGAATVELGTLDGRILTARVVARDEVRDIAVLSADLAGLPGLAFAASTPQAGSTVFAIGSPFGLGQTVTRGIVSALDRPIDVVTPFGMIQHDAPLNPGSSGGPVIDEAGRVIGINTAMPDGFRRDVGIAYAIPAAIAEASVQRLAAGVSIVPRRLGISVRALTPRLAAAVAIRADAGVLVEAVEPGSAAAAAGIAAADVIVAIGATPVRGLRDVAVALDATDPDAAAEAYVIRGNERLVLTLPPAEKPAAAPAPAGAGAEPRRWLEADSLGLGLADSGPARVVSVEPGSPAEEAGVTLGDTVVAVGRARVDSGLAVRRIVGAVVTRPFALLLADAGGATRYVVVDPWAAGLDADGLGGNMRHPRSANY